MTDLEPGWYWVKLTDGWQVVHVFTRDEYHLVKFAGEDEFSSVEELKGFAEKIGPRIPSPDEISAAAPPFIIIPKGWDFEHIDCIRKVVRQEMGR